MSRFSRSFLIGKDDESIVECFSRLIPISGARDEAQMRLAITRTKHLRDVLVLAIGSRFTHHESRGDAPLIFKGTTSNSAPSYTFLILTHAI